MCRSSMNLKQVKLTQNLSQNISLPTVKANNTEKNIQNSKKDEFHYVRGPPIKEQKADVVCLLLKEHTTTQNLAKGIEPETD